MKNLKQHLAPSTVSECNATVIQIPGLEQFVRCDVGADYNQNW